MATQQGDIIEGSRLKEENGVVVSIERVFVVSGLPVGIVADEVLKTALASSIVPRSTSVHPIHSDLFVTSRVPKALGPTIVRVTVTYGLPGGGAFDPPFGSQYMLSGGASVEQTERSIHRLDQFDVNKGDQITVRYQPPDADDAIVQGGTITPFEGRSVMTFGAQIATVAPWLMAEFWVNKVNSGTFFYSQALERTWMITGMDYDLTVRQTPSGYPIYEMFVTMRHNPDTWDPFVIYIDPETGKPPGGEVDAQGLPVAGTGLVMNVGYKTVKWHDEANFNNLFT